MTIWRQSPDLGDSQVLFDVSGGARLHPLNPLLTALDFTLRPTGAALLGYGFGKANDGFQAQLSAGVAFGWKDAPDFLTVEFLYRPLASTSKFTVRDPNNPLFLIDTTLRLDPSYSVRAGFVLGF